MKKIFIITFLSFTLVIYILLSSFQKNIKDNELKSTTQKYTKAYSTVYEEKKQLSKIILSGLKSLVKLEDSLYALKDASSEVKNQIRDDLSKNMKKRYKKLKSLGVKQLHIHLPNSESFLRLHRPEKFGDSLKGIRATVDYVSETGMAVDTFEEGRFFYGFRFVYPLYKDNIYIGSIEISFGAESFTKYIMDQYGVLSNFFIKSSISDKKNFKNLNTSYKPSHHGGYYYDKKVLKTLKNVSRKDMQQLKPSKEFTLKLRQLAQKNEASSLYNEKIDSVFTVIPILNSLSHENVAFLTVRSKPNYILSFTKYNSLILILLIGFFAFLFIIAYVLISQNLKLKESKKSIDKQREHFQSLLNNATDGIHILDEKGNLINCSNSFAKMLGYSKEEVLKLNVKDWDDFIPKDEIIGLVIEIMDFSKEFRTIHKRKDGSTFHAKINARGILLDGKKYLYASSRDISDSIFLQEELEEKNSLLLQVKQIAELGYWRLDLKTQELEWSDEVFNIFELDKNSTKASYDLFVKLIYPDDRKRVEEAYQNSLINKEPYEIEHRLLLENGKIKNVIEKCYTKFDKNAEPLVSIGTIIDNTKEYNFRTNLEKFIDTQENLVILTNDKELKFANKRFFKFFGLENLKDFENKFNHKLILELFIRNDRFFHIDHLVNKDEWITFLRLLPQSKRIVSMLDKDFHVHAFSLNLNDFSDDTTIISFTDISETMLEQINLENKVIHDNLTNAYNREYFEQNYKKLLNSYHNHNSKLAIALLDIDYFKNVNDDFGHDIGDEVLKEFVKTIQRYSRKDDILVRWGGEEFILVLKINSENDLINALENLRKVIELHPFIKVEKITTSIGATIYKDDESIVSTIKRADEAVYKAKAQGRNRVILA